MIDILVVIWIAVAKESRHENGLQRGTEIVVEKKTKIVTDHGIEMAAHDQDLAAGALHLVQTVLTLLLADDLSHDEDHAPQIN